MRRWIALIVVLAAGIAVGFVFFPDSDDDSPTCWGLVERDEVRQMAPGAPDRLAEIGMPGLTGRMDCVSRSKKGEFRVSVSQTLKMPDRMTVQDEVTYAYAPLGPGLFGFASDTYAWMKVRSCRWGGLDGYVDVAATSRGTGDESRKDRPARDDNRERLGRFAVEFANRLLAMEGCGQLPMPQIAPVQKALVSEQDGLCGLAGVPLPKETAGLTAVVAREGDDWLDCVVYGRDGGDAVLRITAARGAYADMRGQVWPAAPMNTEFSGRELITHAKADCQGRPAVYMLAQSKSEPVVDREAAFRALVRTLAAQGNCTIPALV
ncbi:hypothetical protein GCM10023205_00360 [Yinghuangia aomiensis]|uniref:Uncharacterized protein n=1 Tax=Yinghuangia aomiensis TaxID=676205 RepID=A0ABP9GIN0_9ACTN